MRILSVVTYLSLTATSFAYVKFGSYAKQKPVLSTPAEPQTIENSYIVVFKKSVKPGLGAFASHFHQLHRNINLLKAESSEESINNINHIYDEGVVGYSGTFEPKLIEFIKNSDEVEYVEKDQVVYASDLQSGAPWGLARVSQRAGLTISNYDKYYHDPKGGNGVLAYVVDTGVNIEHQDFEGRAEWGKTVPFGDEDIDGNGHGTHVAGTIAGKKYGIAKKAKVIAVKVLRSNGSGSMSDVVAGVSFVAKDAKERAVKASKAGKVLNSVANMSLGGGYSRALNQAVDEAVSNGIHFVVAAGNDNRDACSYSPASSASAITVGSTDLSDNRSSFSNFGPCVNVFAPGRNILSTWIGSKTASRSISGTSMASPHVCGLAAYFLSLADQPLTTSQLAKLITESATKGIVTSPGAGSPNLLIYNNSGN
ncbi:Subtilisin-like protease [Zancudomyces culisetae]|uniref:Subtilisin-like protease n=1 Tax=Zancudomyces culisetae TaxID=1213189 RepID=A0A1R1PV32_ZANCU|nr:Subtilisin-like protease [Zancudomyces culisetae]|eukprot:OMH84827.1 Subtilisin-like protease [Zancudomyces culisetae]